MLPISDRAEAAYAVLRELAKPDPTEAQASAGMAAGFQEVAQDAGAALRDNLSRAEEVSAKALTGQADAQSVVEAVAQAELALQTANVVRDRVVQAYQDILRMPV